MNLLKKKKITAEQLKSIAITESLRLRERLINQEKFLKQIQAEIADKNHIPIDNINSVRLFNAKEHLSDKDSRTIREIDKVLVLIDVFKKTTLLIEQSFKNNSKIEEAQISQIFADLRWMESSTQYALAKAGFIANQISEKKEIQGDKFNDSDIEKNIDFQEANLIHSGYNIYLDKTFMGDEQAKQKILKAFNLFIETPSGNKLMKKFKEVQRSGVSKISISVGDSGFGSAATNSYAWSENLLIGWIRFDAKELKNRELEEVVASWANELFDQMGGTLETSQANNQIYLVDTPHYQLLGVIYDASVKEEILAKAEKREPKPINIKNYISSSPYYGVWQSLDIGRQFKPQEMKKFDELTQLATRDQYKTFQELLAAINPYMNNL